MQIVPSQDNSNDYHNAIPDLMSLLGQWISLKLKFPRKCTRIVVVVVFINMLVPYMFMLQGL